MAFKRFPGTIRFEDDPFPRLQYINQGAFERLSVTSRVELINQKSLVWVGRESFEDCLGSFVVTGDMPDLKFIESEAFSQSSHYKEVGHTAPTPPLPPGVEQVVHLESLPSLVRDNSGDPLRFW